jgi:transposase
MRTHNRRPGRPSLLTPERVDAVVRASAVGAATSLAAEAAGVSRATLARWMGRGRDAAVILGS